MLDSAIHEMMRGLRDARWRETSVPGVEYYYGEGMVYVYRCHIGTDRAHYRVALGKNPEAPLERMGVMAEIGHVGDMLSDGRSATVEAAKHRTHLASINAEYAGLLNMAAARKALEEARDLAEQIERVTGEADVANDAGEIVETCEGAQKAPGRNCERFASWEEARAAFWKEVGDPCDWRKLGAWLFAKVEKEEGAQ